MARPGLRSHPKFKRLLALVRIPEAHLYGHLQMLWDAAYEFGEDIGDDVDVEINAGWTGEPGVLCNAMAACAGVGREGFIEPNPDKPGQWRVHDLYDHAPKYVQKRMEREAERLKRGQTITDIRRTAAKEMHKRKQAKQADANGIHLQTDADKGEQMDASGRTPSPAPSPSPSTSSLRSEGESQLPLEDVRDGVDEVVSLWREIAVPAGLPDVLEVDGKRKGHIKARLKEKGWFDLFKEAITYAARHPEGLWMRGGGSRPWKADLDYFLRQETVLKTVEKARAAGTGTARAPSPSIGHPRRCAAADAAHREQLAQMDPFPTLLPAVGALP
jgi:hypothetical protein